MGSGLFLAENQRVEYESGAGRLCKSIFMAICVAPLLILAMCVLLGWNENRAVCDAKALAAGKDGVTPVGCTDTTKGSGSLVMFTCDIDTQSLTKLSPPISSAFKFEHQGTGLKWESEMYQCIEKDHTETKKTQGGGKKTVHTYTYEKQWKSSPVSTSSFHTSSWQTRCDRYNPQWPSNVPFGKTIYAPNMKVGKFTTTMTASVPVDTPISPQLTQALPVGWQANVSAYSFYKGNSPSSPQIGDIRVSFKSNNPSELTATVLGFNTQGTIADWKAPAGWLCPSQALSKLRMGTFTKDQLFDKLNSEANTLTWILRLVGFALMWLAFCLCFGPLEVAGDCIPCIGPCIGDSIAAISCCVACLPATACTLGVAGIVWVAMRPLVGIPMLLAFFFIACGFGGYIFKARKERGSQSLSPGSAPAAYGATNPSYSLPMVQAPVAPVQAQPVQAQPRMMQVVVPEGVSAGQLVTFTTPEGTQMQVPCPPGYAPGSMFATSY